MKRSFAFLFVLLLIGFMFVVSCGSDDDSSDGEETQTAVISGQATKGPISNAIVRIYAVNDDGTIGKLIAQTNTDGKGYYYIDLAVYTNAVVVEVSGGAYFDEASGQYIDLGTNALYAVAPLDEGSNDVVVTPLSTLGKELALKLLETNTNDENPLVMEAIIMEAYETIGKKFGITNTNILECYPVDLTKETNVSPDDPDAAYGIVLAGFAQMADNLEDELGTNIDPLDIVNALAEDIRADGSLDGKAGDDPIDMGPLTNFTPDYFEEKLVEGMETFITSDMCADDSLSMDDFADMTNDIMTNDIDMGDVMEDITNNMDDLTNSGGLDDSSMP